ncbi:MAG TPA: hypothetical protein VF794_36150, partial [Archangium sp.]|uniref:hypothetical protein n=1 Tax=Archangium sp. TaxID=1872627 RepID=UPI002EDAF4AB
MFRGEQSKGRGRWSPSLSQGGLGRWLAGRWGAWGPPFRVPKRLPFLSPMQRIVILSPHRPSRELLSRLLAEPDLSVVAMADADEALDSIAEDEPALVVVDARRPDEDHPLLLGLLKRRYPRQPLITLVPGRLRVFDGNEERVREVRDGSAEALHMLLNELQRATRD